MRYVLRAVLGGLVLVGQGCALQNLLEIRVPAGLFPTTPRASVAIAASAAPASPGVATPAPPPDCRETFRRYDLDADGAWSLAEFLAYQSAQGTCPPPPPSPTPPVASPWVLPAIPETAMPTVAPPTPTPRPLPMATPVPTPTPTPTPVAGYALADVPVNPNANPAFPIGAPPPACNQPDPQVIFKLMDANQDNQLDPDEVCTLLNGAPPSPTPAPISSDGDGGLNWHAPSGPVTPGGPRPPIALD